MGAFRYDWLNTIVDGPSELARYLYDGLVQAGKDIYGTFTDDRYWYGGYDDPTKDDRFSFYYSIPGIQNMIDYRLDNVNWDFYKDRYNLDDSMVGDPRKKPTARSTTNAVRYGLNFVSRNVSRLYR